MTAKKDALILFGEELGELATEILKLQNSVSKAVRFGINDVYEDVSNHERIQEEWNDVLGSIVNLHSTGIDLSPRVMDIAAKLRKIRKYDAYAKEQTDVQSI